jgi:uncharacterized BrkB/YihY/UPF0761 family membrane protein
MHENWVPIALFGMILGIVAIATYFAFSVRRLQNRERMLAIEKGMTGSFDSFGDASRQVAKSRRTAIVLIATGIGIVLCFAAIAGIEHEMDALNGSAIGIIPLLIGLGLFVDYRLQLKELQKLSETQV